MKILFILQRSDNHSLYDQRIQFNLKLFISSPLLQKILIKLTESNKTTVRNVLFLCSFFTTLIYTTFFGPSWWPSSGVTTIIYKGCYCFQRIRLSQGQSVWYIIHNIKLYVNINKCRCVFWVKYVC
jgi:hypothetical protein